MTDNRFLYSPKEEKRLKKTLKRTPLQKHKGRDLCPFCNHLEARWRSAPVPEEEGTVEVRVLCSQCQRRCMYTLSP